MSSMFHKATMRAIADGVPVEERERLALEFLDGHRGLIARQKWRVTEHEDAHPETAIRADFDGDTDAMFTVCPLGAVIRTRHTHGAPLPNPTEAAYFLRADLAALATIIRSSDYAGPEPHEAVMDQEYEGIMARFFSQRVRDRLLEICGLQPQEASR